jgi:predicted DNA-binding transcriptional regulator YafY
LANEFETSIRTVYRDIDQLSAAGVPVYAERGRCGGFRLLDGYRTRLTGLTPAEAEALFLSGLPGPAAELGLGEAMADAQLKLLAALPAEGQAGAARVASRFHLDPVGWFRNPESADILPILAEAVWKALRIRVRYASWTGVVDRKLEPLGLILKAGAWYLVAGAGDRPRTYRVSAMQTLELAGDGFVRPPNFDLAAYWAGWAKDFEARLYRGQARLRLSPRGLRRLGVLAPAVGEAAARTATAPDEKGWTRVDIPIESLDHAAGELLKLGADAEVLAPPRLRSKMVELAARLGALYSSDRSVRA